MVFTGIWAVAMPLIAEFQWTREIEDRLLAPIDISWIAIEKVVAGKAASAGRGLGSSSADLAGSAPWRGHRRQIANRVRSRDDPGCLIRLCWRASIGLRYESAARTPDVQHGHLKRRERACSPGRLRPGSRAKRAMMAPRIDGKLGARS